MDANFIIADPSLIHPEIGGPPMAIPQFSAPFQQQQQQPHQPTNFPASPSVSSSSPMLRTDSASPFFQNGASYHHTHTPYSHSPYATPIDPNARRPSMSSFVSPGSAEYHSGDEGKEKQRCTYPDCGKVFKDLKAHMLTHQNERPEKCPIQTCEYHTKGFARKYDKNRHTLTHYKGTMVCGFCPGSGSPAEKSFNRADVFKRHLTTVHAVEQTPPNSRKKTPSGSSDGEQKLTGYAPDATGKCSTCTQTFANAQDFYEHLDDCVLRIVQQEDPAEAVNAQHLAEVENDKAVLKTLARHKITNVNPAANDMDQPSPVDVADDDDESVAEEIDDADMADPQSHDEDPKVFGDQRVNPPNGVQKSRGLTHSRGGVPIKVRSKDRKPKRYPASWGDNSPHAANMKKRVLACFDGPRRLVKDDMLLCVDHEMRLKLGDGKHYVTDLDVQTVKRAEGFLGATDEEKGPWISDDPTKDQLREMQEIQDMLTIEGSASS
ncbi:ZnF C2H2 [Geosmithia morbida]|uniref:ZnF C2H2 n=1 Tax=Geosmithia morbida TaxID=1094350 RepID=A0A9P5D2T2_9HYPO|nr:ZnF C2H2 [Geosmithia morbida]KAF4121801.1 ZnF C2H2 [Geosmithia morbida]